jgi:hypothetical protein
MNVMHSEIRVFARAGCRFWSSARGRIKRSEIRGWYGRYYGGVGRTRKHRSVLPRLAQRISFLSLSSLSLSSITERKPQALATALSTGDCVYRSPSTQMIWARSRVDMRGTQGATLTMSNIMSNMHQGVLS